MTQTTITCVSAAIKDAILTIMQREALDDATMGQMLDVPDCDDGSHIGFGSAGGGKSSKKSVAAGGTPRKRSAYNEFVSVCMKGKKIKEFGQAAQGMKECGAEWQQLKKQGKTSR